MRKIFFICVLMLLLTGCDAAYSKTIVIQTPLPQLQYPLIKGSENTVYLIFENQRYPISNWDTFLAWGFEPASIQVVEDEEVKTYPLAAHLYRIISDGETHYFLIEGFRYVVDKPEYFDPIAINSENISQLPASLISLLPLSDTPLPEIFHGKMVDSAIELLPIPDMPNPYDDYEAWLQAFPRPENDNGRCMHYLQTPTGSEYTARLHLHRLQTLGVTWALINYTSPEQLRYLAPLYKSAGITVVWRPFVRPYQHYKWWVEDVLYLRELGVAPYIQILNEPSLGQEWDGKDTDQELFLENLVDAVPKVYEAGGYVGLQFVDLDWLRVSLERLKGEKLDYTFDRLFFVPHPYGGNHPPKYDEDIHSVLGFRAFAQIFEDEIGFVPMMIAGEGGWRLGDKSDSRFPMVSEGHHRDYHVAVFDWFRTGKLSNGEALPDYFFGFCPWLLADRRDPAAWYDSNTGHRQYTIDAVSQLEPFVRRFSWNEH